MILILINIFAALFNLVYGIYALKGRTYATWSKDAQIIWAIIHIALAITCSAIVPVLIFIEMLK